MLRSPLSSSLLFVCFSSGAALVRADPTPSAPAWNESATVSPGVTAPQSVTRAQFFDALGQQVSFVGELRSWRETLRGSGSAPSRALWNPSLAGGQATFAVGDVRAPGLAGFAAVAGTGLGWKNKNGASFDAGTTSRPVQFDRLLQGFDAQISGTPSSAAQNSSSETWLRAKPVSNSNEELEATLLRAARQDGSRWTSGTFGSVNARLALPAKWLARASWTSANFDDKPGRSSWNAAANGPIAHPFGQAQVALNWQATQAGFATFSGAGASGETGNAQITQNIQTPLVKGTLGASLQTLDHQDAALKPGDEQSRSTTSAQADLQLRLAPALSLQATGNASQTQSQLAASPDSPTQLQSSGDLSATLQMTKALSLRAGAGVSQKATQSSQSGQNRLSLGLRLAREKENYALAVQTRDQVASAQTNVPWSHLLSVGVQGERPLIGSWRLQASANWLLDRAASPGDPNGVARQIGAGVSFSRSTRLDVNWRDGAALPSILSGDALGSPFASPTFGSGGREIATRFGFGSAAGGKGLGLALEWARQGAVSAPSDSWKIGVTFK